jgi:hypothetical protein
LFFRPSNHTIAAPFLFYAGAIFWMAIRQKEVAIFKSISKRSSKLYGPLQSRIFEAEPVVSIFDRIAQAQYVDKHGAAICRLMVPRRRSPALMKVLATSLIGSRLQG